MANSCHAWHFQIDHIPNLGKNPDTKVGVVRRLLRDLFFGVKKINPFFEKITTDNQSFVSSKKFFLKKAAVLASNKGRPLGFYW